MSNFRPIAPRGTDSPTSSVSSIVAKRSKYQHDDKAWEAIKPTIYQLYIQENKSAAEVLDALRSNRGNPFKTSRRKLFDKIAEWGLGKNKKRLKDLVDSDFGPAASGSSGPVISPSSSSSRHPDTPGRDVLSGHPQDSAASSLTPGERQGPTCEDEDGGRDWLSDRPRDTMEDQQQSMTSAPKEMDILIDIFHTEFNLVDAEDQPEPHDNTSTDMSERQIESTTIRPWELADLTKWRSDDEESLTQLDGGPGAATDNDGSQGSECLELESTADIAGPEAFGEDESREQRDLRRKILKRPSPGGTQYAEAPLNPDADCTMDQQTLERHIDALDSAYQDLEAELAKYVPESSVDFEPVRSPATSPLPEPLEFQSPSAATEPDEASPEEPESDSPISTSLSQRGEVGQDGRYMSARYWPDRLARLRSIPSEQAFLPELDLRSAAKRSAHSLGLSLDRNDSGGPSIMFLNLLSRLAGKSIRYRRCETTSELTFDEKLSSIHREAEDEGNLRTLLERKERLTPKTLRVLDRVMKDPKNDPRERMSHFRNHFIEQYERLRHAIQAGAAVPCPLGDELGSHQTLWLHGMMAMRRLSRLKPPSSELHAIAFLCVSRAVVESSQEDKSTYSDEFDRDLKKWTRAYPSIGGIIHHMWNVTSSSHPFYRPYRRGKDITAQLRESVISLIGKTVGMFGLDEEPILNDTMPDPAPSSPELAMSNSFHSSSPRPPTSRHPRPRKRKRRGHAETIAGETLSQPLTTGHDRIHGPTLRDQHFTSKAVALATGVIFVIVLFFILCMIRVCIGAAVPSGLPSDPWHRTAGQPEPGEKDAQAAPSFTASSLADQSDWGPPMMSRPSTPLASWKPDLVPTSPTLDFNFDMGTSEYFDAMF